LVLLSSEAPPRHFEHVNLYMLFTMSVRYGEISFCELESSNDEIPRRTSVGMTRW